MIQKNTPVELVIALLRLLKHVTKGAIASKVHQKCKNVVDYNNQNNTNVNS